MQGFQLKCAYHQDHNGKIGSLTKGLLPKIHLCRSSRISLDLWLKKMYSDGTSMLCKVKLKQSCIKTKLFIILFIPRITSYIVYVIKKLPKFFIPLFIFKNQHISTKTFNQI